MKAQLIAWMTTAWHALSYSNRFMTWNLFLAFVPLILSIWLFRQSRSRSIFWWAGLLIFIAFLPNAPYVLTDTIHLVELVRQGYSTWIVTLVVIPQYLLFTLSGFEAYVISVMNLANYLRQQGLKKYILSVELTIHALSAVGIYLGRFNRFNSWDFITHPDALLATIMHDLVGKWQILVITITFGVVAFLYWLLKQVNLGIIYRIRYQSLESSRYF